MKPKFRASRFASLSTVIFAGVLATATQSHAGTIWDGGGADTNIDTAANWDADVVNAINGTTVATFGTGGSTATINTNASFTGITINRAGNFEIANGAGSLTVGTGGITVTLPTTTARSHTISESSLILNGNQTWTVTNNTGAALLTVSSDISETGGARNLIKAGTGTLILSGSNSYTGATSIAAAGGTLRLAHASAVSGSSGITLVSATILQVGTDTAFSGPKITSTAGVIVSDRATLGSGLTHAFSGVSRLGSGNTSITGGTNVNDGNAAIQFASLDNDNGSVAGFGLNPTTANAIVVGGVNMGGGANAGTANFTLGGTAATNSIGGDIVRGARVTANIIKSGTSVWTLTGNNSVSLGTGSTLSITGGALVVNTLAALPNVASTTTINGGTLGVRVGGAGWTTGDVDTFLADVDTIKTAGGFGIDTTNGSLTQWTAFTTGASSFGALGLTKLGTGTLTLNSTLGTNNYTGATTIGQGTLKLDADHTLSGALTFGFGNGTTSPTGSLDLATTNVNATFGALNVLTNSTTANTITIGTGKTLLITGAVTMGYNAGANSNSNLTATGLGTLSIGTVGTPTNANVGIGVGTSSNNGNSGTLDLSGLSTFYANLGTGTFRIGSPTNGTGGTSGPSSVLLAGTSTIQATNLTVGSQDNTGVVPQNLILGNGTNTLNVTNIVISDSGRGSANLLFNSASGNLTVRGLAGGTTRSNLTLADTAFPTSIPIVATFDTTNHDADLRFETMTVAQRAAGSSGSGSATGNFNFNQGTLDANNLIAGSIVAGGSSTGNAIGNVNLSGGNATFNSSTGPMSLGVNVFTKQTGTGNLNISGTANVTVAANAGTSIRLGDATQVGGTATGLVDLTGGTLTVAGDIIRGATTGTSNATIRISGGTLNMGNNDIGATGLGAITLLAESGTLSNVASINGSGGLTKTTGGTLILSGTNSYTGQTLVSAGTLLANGSLGASDVNVQGTATVGGTGSIASTLNFEDGANLFVVNFTNPLAVAGAVTFANFGFANLTNWDYANAANGTYTLISGALVDTTNVSNLGPGDALAFGNGKSGYFQNGSLQVVIIPEPSTALLGAIGLLALLRRRRN